MSGATRIQIRDAAIAAIEAGVTQFATVASFPGRVTSLDQLFKKSFTMPACFVVAPGSADVWQRSGGSIERKTNYVAVIIADRQVNETPDDLAAVLAEAVSNLVAGNDFGLDVDRAENVVDRGLVSSSASNRGVAIWEVVWTHEHCSKLASSTQLGQFRIAHAEWYPAGEGLPADKSQTEVPYDGTSGEQSPPDFTQHIDRDEEQPQ